MPAMPMLAAVLLSMESLASGVVVPNPILPGKVVLATPVPAKVLTVKIGVTLVEVAIDQALMKLSRIVEVAALERKSSIPPVRVNPLEEVIPEA